MSPAPVTTKLAIQDATIRAIDVSAAHTVLYAVYGDSNASGNDQTAAPADWSPRVAASDGFPDFGDLGVNPDVGIWDKWTIGPNASRSSDADTGTGWHDSDVGLLDHGAGVYLGTGQIARGNAIEHSFGLFMRAALLRDGIPAGQPTPTPFQLSICKYGVGGSVVNPTPASPQGGWVPGGGATGAFNVFTTRYLRPAIIQRFAEAGGGGPAVFFGGSVVILGGTDAIDTGSVFTAPGDAEAVDSNLQAVIQGVNDFMGCPKAPVVLAIPPFVNEAGATVNDGYPHIAVVRERIASLAKRRTAAGYRTAAVELQQFERYTDNLHYSNFGLWTAGRECARAMLALGHRLEQVVEVP